MQHPRPDRVALVVVGVEQDVGRCLLDHLGELPSEVDCVLHADVEALSALRGMHVRRVTGEQHAAGAIGRGLASSIRLLFNPTMPCSTDRIIQQQPGVSTFRKEGLGRTISM